MRFRPLLALALAFCLTFIAAPSSVSASGERGNARFADVVNTGKANDCPTISAGSQGSFSIDGRLTDICMHPTEVYVRLLDQKEQQLNLYQQKSLVHETTQPLSRSMVMFLEAPSKSKVVLTFN